MNIAKSKRMKTKKGPDWWEENPLIYDSWGTDPLRHEPGTSEYFEEIDRRLFHAADFAQKEGEASFGSLIPYERLAGKRVLDLGCGAGAHTGLLAKHGASVIACDVAKRALALTKARLSVEGLELDAFLGTPERGHDVGDQIGGGVRDADAEPDAGTHRVLAFAHHPGNGLLIFLAQGSGGHQLGDQFINGFPPVPRLHVGDDVLRLEHVAERHKRSKSKQPLGPNPPRIASVNSATFSAPPHQARRAPCCRRFFPGIPIAL